MIDKRLRILDQNVDLDYWRINHRAQSTTPRAEHAGREQMVEITPTKATKGSRFIDAMKGRKLEHRVGMGIRSVFDRL